MSLRVLCLAATAALAACSAPTAPTGEAAANEAADLAAPPPAPAVPVAMPDDRTPAPEAPPDATSAQGAASVVQSYFDLLEAGRRREARQTWSDGGGSEEARFAAGLAASPGHRARIGAPGAIEGAAGSLYVEVPVTIDDRRQGGAAGGRELVVTLRRVNDVPGSSAEQRRWHIQSISAAEVTKRAD